MLLRSHKFRGVSVASSSASLARDLPPRPPLLSKLSQSALNFLCRLLMLVSVVGLSACSTVIVDKTAGVAAAGKKYTETLKKVNDLALQRSVNFDAALLASYVPPRDPQALQRVTQTQKDRQRIVAESSAYLNLIADYFSSLEALAKGDVVDSTSASFGRLADSLRSEPYKVSLTDERKAALTGLAGFVARQAHASSVEKALRRDADTVARAIALSREMLNVVSGWIVNREMSEEGQRFKDRVEKPYSSTAPLGAEWQSAWKSHVRGPDVIAVLSDAKEAGADLELAWRNLLAGKNTFDDVLASLKNAQAGVDAAVSVIQSK